MDKSGIGENLTVCLNRHVYRLVPVVIGRLFCLRDFQILHCFRFGRLRNFFSGGNCRSPNERAENGVGDLNLKRLESRSPLIRCSRWYGWSLINGRDCAWGMWANVCRSLPGEWTEGESSSGQFVVSLRVKWCVMLEKQSRKRIKRWFCQITFT